MKTTHFFILTLFVFSQSLLAQKVALVNEIGQFGYINSEGEYIIQPQFKKAKDFSGNGLAPVKNDKKWGYINIKGEWVITPQFDEAETFNSGLALVEKDGKEFFINIKGDVKISPMDKIKFYDFNEYGTTIIKRGDYVGLMDSEGNIIVDFKYQVIKPFVNGYAKVKLNNLWGMINFKGEGYIKPEYVEIGDYMNGVVKAKNSTGYKLIDDKGDFIEVKNVIKIWDFRDGGDLTMAMSSDKGEKIGYINKKGEWVIPPTFKVARHFVNGLAPVYNGRRWGYIDTSGKYVIEPEYNDAEIFGEQVDLAPIKPMGTSNWGFVNSKGEKVLPAEFLITSAFSFNRKIKGFLDSFARVKHNNKWVFLTKEGKYLGDKRFLNANIFVEIEKN